MLFFFPLLETGHRCYNPTPDCMQGSKDDSENLSLCRCTFNTNIYIYINKKNVTYWDLFFFLL